MADMRNLAKKFSGPRIAVGGAVIGVVAVAVPASIAIWDPARPAEPQAPPSCEIAALDGPEGLAVGNASSVSADGEYVAGSAGGEIVLWHDGEATVIRDPDAGPDDHALSVDDVNSSGVVVGERVNAETDNNEAWIYRDDSFSLLQPPEEYAGESVRVSAINDSGDIVGNTWQDSGLEPEIPLKWTSESDEPEPEEPAQSDSDEPEPTESGSEEPSEPEESDAEESDAAETAPPVAVELELGAGMHGEVFDISEAGMAVGYQQSIDDEGPHVPWVWQADGTGAALPADDDYYSHPATIVGDWVLAGRDEADSAEHRWNVAGGEAENLDIASALTMDDTGRVYGAVDTEHAGTEGDDGVTALPGLHDGPSESRSNNHQVNDAAVDGSVLVGESLDKDDTTYPVTWSCN